MLTIHVWWHIISMYCIIIFLVKCGHLPLIMRYNIFWVTTNVQLVKKNYFTEYFKSKASYLSF